MLGRDLLYPTKILEIVDMAVDVGSLLGGHADVHG
jgi:hypothetical protein